MNSIIRMIFYTHTQMHWKCTPKYKGQSQTSFARSSKSLAAARHQWLTSVILATQEAEIRRIV
jgi:hypothetical protein